MSKKTRTLESSTQKKIDIYLKNLGWNTDEESPECNVTTERALTVEQNKKLKGNQPDYVLYKSKSTDIIGIVETKQKGKNLNTTLEETIDKYAIPLKAPIVFITDGTFFIVWDVERGRELTLDGKRSVNLYPKSNY